ncbi:hypothetical protein [Primorskyibacter sp. S187A]|uniref:hypothetical protein n=1 Tax=Primorskyibacter sp. S187A TaxID=3415130 RepID=UPI003C7A8EC0
MAFFATLPASDATAEAYACSSKAFCRCESEDGCSSVAAYPDALPKMTCGPSDVQFDLQTKRRSLQLQGATLKLTLREARPYFGDMDRYQAGATATRGLINFRLDNESRKTPFQMREMAAGSVNDTIWRLEGTCEVMN